MKSLNLTFLTTFLLIIVVVVSVGSSPAKDKPKIKDVKPVIKAQKVQKVQKPVIKQKSDFGGDDEAEEDKFHGKGNFESEFAYSAQLFSSGPRSGLKGHHSSNGGSSSKGKKGSPYKVTSKISNKINNNNRRKYNRQVEEDDTEEVDEVDVEEVTVSPGTSANSTTTNTIVREIEVTEIPESAEIVNEVDEIDEETTTSRIEVESPTISPGNFTLEDEFSSLSTYFVGQGRATCECGRNGFKISGGNSRINEQPWTKLIQILRLDLNDGILQYSFNLHVEVNSVNSIIQLEKPTAIVKDRIFTGGRPHCSGTLINDKYVLTAAHCLDGFSLGRMEVWLTAHDSLEESQRISNGNIKRSIEKVIMHPNYSRRDNDNDIALLRLDRGVDISAGSFFVPICLPAANSDYAGVQAKIMAWSSVSQGFNQRITNYRICKAEIPVMKNDVCNRDTRHSGKVTENMLCAGFLSDTRDETCLSDAGGPLVMPNGGRATLIGLASWGYHRNTNSYDPSPTVFSRVAGYADWILHNTRDADWCNI